MFSTLVDINFVFLINPNGKNKKKKLQSVIDLDISTKITNIG